MPKGVPEKKEKAVKKETAAKDKKEKKPAANKREAKAADKDKKVVDKKKVKEEVKADKSKSKSKAKEQPKEETKEEKKKRKKKDADAPKKPVCSFFWYQRDPKNAITDPAIVNHKDKIREMSKIFKTLSPADKAPYEK